MMETLTTKVGAKVVDPLQKGVAVLAMVDSPTPQRVEVKEVVGEKMVDLVRMGVAMVVMAESPTLRKVVDRVRKREAGVVMVVGESPTVQKMEVKVMEVVIPMVQKMKVEKREMGPIQGVVEMVEILMDQTVKVVGVAG